MRRKGRLRLLGRIRKDRRPEDENIWINAADYQAKKHEWDGERTTVVGATSFLLRLVSRRRGLMAV